MTLQSQVQLKIRKPDRPGVRRGGRSPQADLSETVCGPLRPAHRHVEVRAGRVVPHRCDERLVFDVGIDEATFEFAFKPMNGEETMVQVTESGWPDTPEGVRPRSNAGGWMFMLTAYLEYGINLRAGGLF
jgi:uncharacterized protein YndB with AHSA1/START domain